jgi:hypothetical protein
VKIRNPSNPSILVSQKKNLSLKWINAINQFVDRNILYPSHKIFTCEYSDILFELIYRLNKYLGYSFSIMALRKKKNV